MHLFDHQSPSTVQESSEAASNTILSGVNLIHDILKTVLGPNGSLKVLTSPPGSDNPSLLITNDGATILKNLLIDNPAARLLIDSSVSQDKEEGDGTTSVALLSCLFVKESFKLDIHKINIVRGFQHALERCLSVLEKLKVEDVDLFYLAKTTLSSKVLRCDLNLFSKICVDAISQIYKPMHNKILDKNNVKLNKIINDANYNNYLKNIESNENDLFVPDIGLINIIKVPGKLEDSFYVHDGFILDCQTDIPEPILNPKILLANTSMDYDKVKVFGAKIEVKTVKELSLIEDAEKTRMKNKINKICFNEEIKEMKPDLKQSKSSTSFSEAIKSTFKRNKEIKEDGSKPFFDVFINRQIMYDFPKQIFKNNKVLPIEHANFEGIERLSKILNAKVLSSFYNKMDENVLGTCTSIENVRIGGKKMIKFNGISKGAGTIVLCGSSDDILNEAERSIHDALCVLRNKSVVTGGGSIESILANDLFEYAKTIKGSMSAAIIAFGNALLEIPKIIAINSGMDGEKIKALLRSKNLNKKQNKYFGIDVSSMGIADMKNKGIYESYTVKKRVLKCACETAQVLIKCDGFVKCAPRQRERM